MENNPVMCFYHCRKDKQILCLELPKFCPVCSGDLYTTPLLIPPFRAPSPFLHSREAPYSVVVKPTVGTFFDECYNKNSDLHVGVTDSRGVVFHYDKSGLHRSSEGWDQCISVPIIDQSDTREQMMWDIRLAEFTTYNQWVPERYDEVNHNCNDFAMAFLQLVELSEKHPSINDRSSFSKIMVSPRTSKGARYIVIYRKVLAQRVIVESCEESTAL